jgi:crotonobetaine/carnitine-CoA ligase
MILDNLLETYPFAERLPVRVFHELAGRRGGSVAAIDAATGRSYSWAQLASRAEAVAGALTSLGVTAGDRVVWSAPTGVDAISIWMGIAQLGAIDVGIGDALQGAVLDHLLQDSAPAALITHHGAERGLRTLSPTALAAYPRILALGPSAARPTTRGVIELDLDSCGDTAPGNPDLSRLRPSDPTTIVYTSGTTGPSKGVVMCHHQQFFTGANLAEQFRVNDHATLYHYSPFNHVTGRQLVMTALLTRSTLVMRPRFSLARFWTDINAHQVSHAITLGSAVPLLMDVDPNSTGNADSLRYVWASPAMPALYAEFAARHRLRVCSPYGSTEVGIVVEPGVTPDEPGPPGNSGRVSRFFEMATLDDDDQILPAGAVGEIAVRPKLGWTTFLGYHGRTEAMVDRTHNLWYHSGDLGRLDEDGWLFFVDRKQDFIRSKGENISSIELEQVLAHHPHVSECAVVPVASHLADADVLVALTPSGGAVDGFDPEAFYTWCAEQVPHYMVPRYVRVLDDLPRGQSGKIEKHKLRAAGATTDTWDANAAGLRATRRGLVRTEPSPVSGA